jgi:site-specific recombinase XerD
MLTIFVRHSRLCLEGDGTKKKPGLRSLPPKELRVYKRCSCPKWYTGTHNGVWHPRAALNACTWEAAERAVEKIMSEADGKARSVPAPAVPPASVAASVARPAADDPGMPVPKAVIEWLRDCENEGIVIRPYNTMARVIEAWVERTGLRGVKQITPLMISQWRSSWLTEKSPRKKTPGLKSNTRKTRQRHLHHFLQFCVRAGLLEKNPLAQLTATRRSKKRRRDPRAVFAGGERDTATLPLDPNGGSTWYDRILAYIPKYFAPKFCAKNGQRYVRRAPLATRPASFLALAELMYHTGMRISDTCLFEIDQVEPQRHGCGSYTFTQYKTGRLCTVVIEPWLLAKLRALPRLTARYLFWNGKTRLNEWECNQVGFYLHEIGAHLGMPENLRAHRFRDSFAINRYNEGWSMKQISVALGHKNVQTTEDAYLPHVKARHDAEVGAWIDRVKPAASNVIEMPA